MRLGRRWLSVRLVQQMEAAECGVACLAMLLEHHGHHRSLPELREVAGTSRDGNSALELLAAARFFGLDGRGVSVAPEDLGALRAPAILHWELNHFVVLERAAHGYARIVDPASGRRVVDRETLERSFSGVALELVPSPRLERRRRSSPSLARYGDALRSMRGPVAFVVTANVTQQFFALLFPAASQLFIDHVIQPRRQDWLLPVLALLASAAVAQLALERLHGRAQATLEAAIGVRLTTELGERLLALPLPFLESRSHGDLLERVRQQALLPGLLTRTAQAGFDIFFVVLLALVLLAYDRFLGGLALALAAARLLLVCWANRATAQRAAAELAARAREHATLVEATSASELTKAMRMEARLAERHAARVMERAGAGIRSESLRHGLMHGISLLGAATQAVILWVGGGRVISGEMTIGVFAGFIATRAMIESPLSSLVDLFGGWVRFQSALERCDDVLTVAPAVPGTRAADRLTGKLELRNVGFRYGSGGAWVLRDVSLCVSPGQHVVLMGPSGQGKSTLAKLMCGLLEPTEGSVLLDGVEVREYDRGALARQLGVVLQETFVVEGSVAENLRHRIPDASSGALERAAALACFDEVVERLPLGYDTTLLDRGANLSGGERQRLAIACALVGDPRLLLLDEATSALDVATEQRVLHNLAALRSTRISVAHRQSVAAQADRVLWVSGEGLRELGAAQEVAPGAPAPSVEAMT